MSTERPDQVVYPVLGVRATAVPGTQESTPVLSEASVRRHGGRVLDPDTAAQPVDRRIGKDKVPGPRVRYRPTAYVADQILLPADEHGFGDELGDWASEIGLYVPPLSQVRQRARSSYLSLPITAYDAVPPDAWRLVQHVRDRRPELASGVGLNHLMVGAEITGTKTFRRPVSVDSASAGADYTTPGWGGRGPVALHAAPPPRRDGLARRPVVAILDTGVADHPWFAGCIERLALDPGHWVVPAEDERGKEVYPNLIDPLQGELDPYFGHGTFIAGLVRQHCPDADLLSIKVMGPDGVVEEAALLGALDYLVHRQKAAQAAGGDPTTAVDIVSISLGYYHEDPADGAVDGPLKERLDRLRSLGVTVVAAAGNDSTTRPFLPAAFASYAGGARRNHPPSALVTVPADFPADRWPPLVSVGALNPSKSIALFSNGGDWVSCYAPGALLVSTTPIQDSAAQPGFVIDASSDGQRGPAGWRSSLDPDFFTGFGTWSGTSFAAPIMAGELGRQIVDAEAATLAASGTGSPALSDVTAPSLADRAYAALATMGFPA